MNMAPDIDRRKRFKVAMARLEESQAAFARRHKVSNHHLHCVLRGERKSQRLEALIDEAIARAESLPSAPGDAIPQASAA